MGTTGVRTVLYPVRDLAKAKELFTHLAWREPIADSPCYVGYDLDGKQIGLVPNGRDAAQAWSAAGRPSCPDSVAASYSSWLVAPVLPGRPPPSSTSTRTGPHPTTMCCCAGTRKP